MKRNLLFSILLVVGLSTNAAAESLTLTTYYPAPFGAYDRMRFVPRPAIGGTSCDLGTIFYNSDDDKLTMCAAFDADGEWVPITGPKGGVWQQEDLAGETNVYLTDWQNMDLRVGIGTDDPTAMFEILDTGQTLSGERGHFSIFGDANIDSDVADMNFDGGPDANFTIVHNGADGSNSRTRFMWVDPNTGTWHNRMDIWNSGRVAINSDGGPWGNFQVDGDTGQFGVNAGWANAQPWPTSSDPWPYIWFNGFNNSGACTGWTCTPGFNFRFFRGTSSARTTAQSDDWLGYINFGSGDTANGGYTSASIGGIASENQVFGTNQGGQLVFNTTANGSTSLLERMRITHDGKVGIGTAAPQARLHVDSGDRTVNWGSQADQLGGEVILQSKNTEWSLIGEAETFWSSAVKFPEVDASGNFTDTFVLWRDSSTHHNALKISYDTGSANWWESAPTLFTILSDGRVGIGTDGPEESLHVASDGDVILEGTGSARIELRRTSSSYPRFNMGTNGAIDALRFSADTGSGFTFTDPILKIFSNQRVGISGGLAVAQYTLDVWGGDINTNNGGYRDSGSCVAGTCASDRQLKEDIRPLDGALQTVRSLNPVQFRFKDEHYGSGVQYGLIAQDVEKLFPQWVTVDDDGVKNIRYGLQFEMFLIQAVKDQQQIIDGQRSEIEGMREEMERLNERLQSVENVLGGNAI